MLAEPGGWDSGVWTPGLSGRLRSLEAGLESACWAGLSGDLCCWGFWLLLLPGGTLAVTGRWGGQVEGC